MNKTSLDSSRGSKDSILNTRNKYPASPQSKNLSYQNGKKGMIIKSKNSERQIKTQAEFAVSFRNKAISKPKFSQASKGSLQPLMKRKEVLIKHSKIKGGLRNPTRSDRVGKILKFPNFTIGQGKISRDTPSENCDDQFTADALFGITLGRNTSMNYKKKMSNHLNKSVHIGSIDKVNLSNHISLA